MAKNIELFYFPPSFYSMKVRMYLCEKGVTPKLHKIDIRRYQNLTDEYLKLNPAGKVPVIKSGGTIVPDSDEIFKYGEDNIPGDSLVPSHISDSVWKLHDEIHALPVDVITFGTIRSEKYSKEMNVPPMILSLMIKKMRADPRKAIEKRLASASKEMVPLLSKKLEWARELHQKSSDPAAVEAALKATEELLSKCEAQLEASSGPFLFGSTVTIPDIDLAVLTVRLTMLGHDKRFYPEGGPLPHLRKFIKSMEQRRSYQLVLGESRKIGPSLSDLAIPIAIGSLVVVGVAIGIAVFIKRK